MKLSPHQAHTGEPQPGRVELIALDLDGTVLSPLGEVTPRTRSAIRAVLDAGIKVCIATGRSWAESQEVIRAAGLEGPGVFVGGAAVNDLSSGAWLTHTKMDPATAREACAIVEDRGLAAMVMQDASRADVEWLISAESEMPPTVPEWLARHNSSYRRVAGLRSAAHDYTIRVSTVGYERQCAGLAARLRERLGSLVYLHEIKVPMDDVVILEVFDSSVNKWQGVRQVARLLDVDLRAIVAIGDEFNDLHMLDGAAVGVAMGNARPEVKAVADLTIASNAHDGLAEYLEGLVAEDAQLTSAHRQG